MFLLIKKRNTPLQALFIVQGLFSVIYCFGNVFLNVFLWDNGQTFYDIGVFNLFSVSSIFLFSLIGAYLLPFWGTRFTFITSSILAFVMFTTLILSTHSLPNKLPLIGVLYGGNIGLYYIGFNLTLIQLTGDSRRNYYIGLESALTTAGQLLTPLVSGILIVSYGYRPIFLAILGLVIIQILCSIHIPNLRTTESYQLHAFLFPENKMVAKIGASSTAYGFYFSFIQMSYGLFIYFIVKDQFHLGSWNFFFSLISAIMYWVVGKQLNQSNKDIILSLGMIASMIVTLGMLLSEPYWFILFNLVVSVSLPLLWIPAKSIHFAYIKSQDSLEKMIQFLVYREFSISLGRIVFFLFTIIGFELGIGFSYYSMILLAIFMPFGIWFLNRRK